MGEVRRKRPIPIPIFQDRFIERPYQRKEELSLIRNNLEELVAIKTGSDETKVETPKVETSKIEIPKPEIFKSEVKSEITNNVNYSKEIETKIPEIKIPEIKILETKVQETKLPETKIGIRNLVDKKIENKQIGSKQTENKSKKRKVINMNDDEQVLNMSPELRRQLRKSEMEEYHNEKETNEAIKRAASLAEQNKLELEQMKKSLASENAEIRRDLKSEFGNKFNELSGKFNDITGKFEGVNGKFDGVSKKLEETCTGIDCLKEDMKKLNKNVDLIECPECGLKVVPPLASYCPNCSAKMTAWTEDDGTPVKGWKPSWENKLKD